MKLRQLNQRAIVVIVALALIMIACIASLYLLNKKTALQEEPIITYSTDKPDESKTKAQNYQWHGAADEPKKLVIGKLSIDTFLQKAGIDQDKKVAVPNNIHLGAWFAHSAKPGKNGLSIISAHVSGRTQPGIFKDLDKLTKGDRFDIQLGSGQVISYEVLSTTTLRESEAASALFSQEPTTTKQVNLITCGGKFDQTKNQYEDRILVAAKQI